MLAIAELGLAIFSIIRIRRIIKAYRNSRATALDGFQAFEWALAKGFNVKKIPKVLLDDLFLVTLGLVGWWKTPRPIMQGPSFTMHQTVQYLPILCGFMAMIGFETLGVHILLSKWSPMTAWIMTVLSLYAMLWLAGDYHAIRLRVPVLLSDRLIFRAGFRWEGDILLENIESAQYGSLPDQKLEPFFKANPFFHMNSNFRMVLKEPIIFWGLFGLRKSALCIDFHFDDPKALWDALEARMGTIQTIRMPEPAPPSEPKKLDAKTEALICAIQNGKYQIAKVLATSGADLQAVDKMGRSAWEYAQSDPQMVQLLEPYLEK